jgi:putative RecB family exonuclease
VQQAWEQVLAVEPGAAEMFAARPRSSPTWLASCRESLARYFDLEDPRRLEPAHREEYVETLLESRLLLRGVVDRIDVAPDGAIRVVDYKTGHSPAVGFEGQALFQMRFYALVIWRTRGVVPALLRLIYLGDGEMVSYVPDEADLLATERLVQALWEAIRTARETGDWRPSPARAARGARSSRCARRSVAPRRRSRCARSHRPSPTSRLRPTRGSAPRSPRPARGPAATAAPAGRSRGR